MRIFVFLFFTGVLVLATLALQQLYHFSIRDTNLAAAFVNDSVIIKVDQPGPTIPPPENTVIVGSDPVPNDTNSNTSSNTNTTPNANEPVITFSDSSNTNTTPVITQVEVSSETSSNSNTTQNSGGGNSSQTTQIVNADTIVTTLIGSQAVVTSHTGGGGGTIDSIRIFAANVRKSLLAQGIAHITLPDFGTLTRLSTDNKHRFTENDFALFASSALLQDEYLDDISYTGGVLETRYRALGRLFGFAPTRYTLRVSITISQNGSSTVKLRFPWYKFFLWTGVSTTALQNEIADEVSLRLMGGDGSFDLATRAFSAVADVLSKRAGV